jgi:hypothetical protein
MILVSVPEQTMRVTAKADLLKRTTSLRESVSTESLPKSS